jgi:hypothetical protein
VDFLRQLQVMRSEEESFWRSRGIVPTIYLTCVTVCTLRGSPNLPKKDFYIGFSTFIFF